MRDVHNFPTLFKRKGKNKVLQWDIFVAPSESVEGAYEIVTRYGEQGGSIQETSDTITSGKNIGKSNETTPKMQAQAEADSKWVKKQEREGYVQDIEDIDKDLRPGVEPMLAHRYDKSPEKIEFPCYTQPKLDGHRCIAVIKHRECKLYSRKREEITGLPHINEFLANHFRTHLSGDLSLILDGELYNHDYKDRFEELSGFIRSKEPKEGHEAVQYHVYDVVNEGSFQERLRHLSNIRESIGENPVVKTVETHLVEQDQVTEFFKYFLSQGFEGAMLRNLGGLYVGKRSYDLQKVKEFEDAEFKICGVTEGRGKLAGHAIFSCALRAEDMSQESYDSFDVKLKGDTARLKEIFENQDAYIGKLLTVQFQGRTKNGIPRFPVGLRLREDV